MCCYVSPHLKTLMMFQLEMLWINAWLKTVNFCPLWPNVVARGSSLAWQRGRMLLCLKVSVHLIDLLLTGQCWTGRVPTDQLWTRYEILSCIGNSAWGMVAQSGHERGFCGHPCVIKSRCNFFHILQRSPPFVQRRDMQQRQMQLQRRPNRQMDSQKLHGFVSHRPFPLQRKWYSMK